MAQTQSNRGRKGRKKDFPDAERLVKRLVAQELILSFVPQAEQRLWRAVTRRKYQLTRNRAPLHNRLESLLEEVPSKFSRLVSDLLGVSARRMLNTLAAGETNPLALDALAHQRVRATETQLTDALGACTELNPVYRRLLTMALEVWQFIEQQRDQLEQEIAALRRQHEDAVQRLAQVPGLGVDPAQQIIAEVGATAPTFASAKNLASWVGACPGDEESAEVSKSHRSPKGSRHIRRILNQAANAAVRTKGSIPDRVSSAGAAARTPSNHRSDCSSPLPPHLAHSPSRSALRRTWPCAEPRVEIPAYPENDSGTAKTRLSGRMPERRPQCSSTSAVIFDPALRRTWPCAEPKVEIPAYPAE